MSAIGKGDLVRCISRTLIDVGIAHGTVWVCAGIEEAGPWARCTTCTEAGNQTAPMIHLEGYEPPAYHNGHVVLGLCVCGFVPIYKPPPADVEADECGWLDRRQPNLIPEPA